MTNPTTPATIMNSDLLAKYGDRWDIRRELSIGILSAERRSPDGRHRRFLAAHSAGELAGLIEHAETDRP